MIQKTAKCMYHRRFIGYQRWCLWHIRQWHHQKYSQAYLMLLSPQWAKVDYHMQSPRGWLVAVVYCSWDWISTRTCRIKNIRPLLVPEGARGDCRGTMLSVSAFAYYHQAIITSKEGYNVLIKKRTKKNNRRVPSLFSFSSWHMRSS